MSETNTPAPQRTGMSTGSKVALTIGIVVVALLVVGAVVTAVLLGTGRSTIDTSESVEAGSSIDVDIPNGTLVLLAGDDENVTVAVEGRYLFEEPRVRLETNGGVTRIDGGCPTIMPMSMACSVTVTITVPSESPVTIVGTNGAITATGLTGDLDFGTTNGSIAVAGSAGTLDLRTTNGAVSITDSESTTVAASTVNGSISLDFTASPADVDAAVTNGSITIVVPDEEPYAIDIDTVNGGTDIVKVVNDPQAERSIVGRTVNGSVTVRAA